MKLPRCNYNEFCIIFSGTSFQIMLSSGVVYAFAFGTFLQWYYLAFVCWIPSVLFAVTMYFQSESPVWFVIKNEHEKARAAYVSFRGKVDK